MRWFANWSSFIVKYFPYTSAPRIPLLETHGFTHPPLWAQPVVDKIEFSSCISPLEKSNDSTYNAWLPSRTGHSGTKSSSWTLPTRNKELWQFAWDETTKLDSNSKHGWSLWMISLWMCIKIECKSRFRPCRAEGFHKRQFKIFVILSSYALTVSPHYDVKVLILPNLFECLPFDGHCWCLTMEAFSFCSFLFISSLLV